MDLQDLIQDDYQLFDGEECVKVTFNRAAGQSTEHACNALRRSIRIRESGGEWILSSSETFWTIGKKELPQAPKEGDVITEECGTAWTVDDVEFATLKSRYRCRCTKQR